MIGAIFSKMSDKSSEVWFWLPAMFAMSLAAADFLFISLYLKETLPRVSIEILNQFMYLHFNYFNNICHQLGKTLKTRHQFYITSNGAH